MATSVDFIEFVCSQFSDLGDIRYKKMFGEYMVYVNDRPVLLVCDNTVYVKKLEELADLLEDAETGNPYKGAKEHYILDVDDIICSKQVVNILKEIIPIPKPKSKRKKPD